MVQGLLIIFSAIASYVSAMQHFNGIAQRRRSQRMARQQRAQQHAFSVQSQEQRLRHAEERHALQMERARLSIKDMKQRAERYEARSS